MSIVENNDPTLIGRTSVAHGVNRIFKTTEVTEHNLYKWLDGKIPKIEAHTFEI